jgi:predicted MPP superfamily phosphohydrolase
MIWLGLSVYLFIFAILYAVILLIAKISPITINTHIVGLIFIISAVVVSIYGIINARFIDIKEVSVQLDNIPDIWKDRKVLFISDIHFGAIYGANYSNKIADIIKETKPDILFIGGDLFDGGKVDWESVLAPISDIRPALGIYFVTGNHEEFRDHNFFVEKIEKAGIKVLKNEMIEIDGLQIVGVYDRDSIKREIFENILKGLSIKSDMPAILLKHQPSGLDIAEKYGIDLQISGHTHRAQMWPLNIFPYIIFKGYSYGLLPFGSMQVLNSSGASTWGPPMRVGSRSEVVVVSL